ncbi:hypothetical protein MKW92_005663 [Papaver armeniacum]|nr:hypothetical protein MKW92_005663 [Papaver armeniacum]
MTIQSEVTNGQFAKDQKWVIEKIVFVGLKKKKSSLFRRHAWNLVQRTNDVSAPKVTFNWKGSFGVGEVTGLSQTIAKNFNLKFQINYTL